MTAPQPVMRTASTENLDILHPVANTQNILNGVNMNVERLEQSAEELSQGGSDIGEEIRKLHEEQRRSDSRRSSVASRDSRTNQPGLLGRSRNASTSSYSNSIVDLNKEARWGGYSPSGFIGSPSASIHSGTWSHLHRTASNVVRPEPVQEGRPLDSPLASPQAFIRHSSQSSLARSASIHDMDMPEEVLEDEQEHEENDGTNSQRAAEGEMAPQELPAHAEEGHNDDYRPATPPDRPPTTDTYRQAHTLFEDFDGVHFSPAHEEFVELDEHGNETRRVPLTNAHEILQATPRAQRQSYAAPPPGENMVFYPAPVPRMLNLPKRLSMNSNALLSQRKSQMFGQPQQAARQSAPFIPNLDFEKEEGLDEIQDLRPTSAESSSSHGPHAQSPQRSPQKSGKLNARQSMAGLPARQSVANLRNLPPQLRASVFFDQPSVHHDVDIQSESAVATLDSILAASATAPVTVFTDHPSGTRLPADYYKGEPMTKRHTLSSPLIDEAKNPRAMLDMRTEETRRAQHRRSISGLLSGTNGDRPKTGRRNSVMSMLTDFGQTEGRKLQRKSSRMSLATDMDLGDDGNKRESTATAIRDGDYEDEQDERTPLTPEKAGQGEEQDVDVQGDEDDTQQEDMGPVYAQPTTLLAELQLRKAHQKTRNRTAATAFPNGMHSTLLEMDAVAQIEKRKRQNHKVALAWEDPTAHANDEEDLDDDVPLAVLYGGNVKGKDSRRGQMGAGDWDRPLGLIERRQMEDNEPLSRRRNRILGVDPRAQSRANMLASAQPSPTDPQAPLPEQDEEEDLPLRERLRRLKQREALSSALGDINNKDAKSTFGDDMLSQFGGGLASKQAAATTLPDQENIVPENETLGQRRARLQRQGTTTNRNVSDPTSTDSPDTIRPSVLRSSTSLANILTANPAGNSNLGARTTSGPAPGTLLREAEKAITANKTKLRAQNARTVSHGQQQQQQRPGMQTAQSSMTVGHGQRAPASFGGGLAGMGTGMGMHSSMSTPALALGPQTTPMGGYFAGGAQQQQQMPVPSFASNFSMQQHQLQAMQQQMQMQMMGYQNPYPFAQQGQMMMNGMHMQMPMGGMPMQTGLPVGMHMGMPGPMGYGLQGELPADMHPQQRDLIDRWRSSVAQ